MSATTAQTITVKYLCEETHTDSVQPHFYLFRQFVMEVEVQFHHLKNEDMIELHKLESLTELVKGN